MYMGNNYRVAIKNGSLWHEEYFIDEISARKYANEMYLRKCKIVELWKRDRTGYRLVKAVKQ